MKAIYQRPATETVVLETNKMMASSGLLNNSLGDNSLMQDLSTIYTTTETDGNLSRRHSLWDDDDDDDDDL